MGARPEGNCVSWNSVTGDGHTRQEGVRGCRGTRGTARGVTAGGCVASVDVRECRHTWVTGRKMWTNGRWASAEDDNDGGGRSTFLRSEEWEAWSRWNSLAMPVPCRATTWEAATSTTRQTEAAARVTDGESRRNFLWLEPGVGRGIVQVRQRAVVRPKDFACRCCQVWQTSYVGRPG